MPFHAMSQYVKKHHDVIILFLCSKMDEIQTRDFGRTDVHLGFCVNVDESQIGPQIFKQVQMETSRQNKIFGKYKQVSQPCKCYYQIFDKLFSISDQFVADLGFPMPPMFMQFSWRLYPPI